MELEEEEEKDGEKKSGCVGMRVPSIQLPSRRGQDASSSCSGDLATAATEKVRRQRVWALSAWICERGCSCWSE